jgi:hypothetical protein
MVAHEPEIAGVSVVLLGSFNPQIFQPAWFALQQLLPQAISDEAEVNVVHPEIVDFEADWLSVQVRRDRLSLTTVRDPAEQLRDLALGVLSILRHTPVRVMGINREVHVRMRSEDEWHAVGHRLAPQANWGLLREPGMENLTIRALRPDGDQSGLVRVIVEPSNRIQPGVYVQVNDQYTWPVEPGETALPQAVKVLEAEWESSLNRAGAIIDAVLWMTT